MKKHLLLTSLVTFLAAGCGGVKSSSTSTNSTSSINEVSSLISEVTSSSTISSTKVDASWTNEEKSLMESYLGFVLPCPNFTVERHVEIAEDEEGDFLYIYADNEKESVFEEYLVTLEDNGYALAGVDSSYGYDMYIYFYDFEEKVYAVQANYFPGSQDVAKGIEIYAWLYDDGTSGGGKGEVITSTTYPHSDLNAWLEANNVTATVPSFTASVYKYAYTDSTFEIQCSDDGVPGINAIEDSYKAALEKAGWNIDATSYDVEGYYAYSPDGKLETLFYTYGGLFYVSHLAIEAASGDSDENVSETYPQEAIDSWLESCGLSMSLPTFEANLYVWIARENEFIIGCADNGEVGVNAIEDTHKAALEALNWTIDDTFYSKEGYYALAPDSSLVAQFFTFEGQFFITYTLMGSNNGELRHYPSFPQTQLDTYLSLKGLTCPIPTFAGTEGTGFYSAVCEVEGLPGDVFVIQVDDYGNPGADALEDSYIYDLQDAGWTIDDTYYEELGYIASYPNSNAEILFYTWDYTFVFFLYVNE